MTLSLFELAFKIQEFVSCSNSLRGSARPLASTPEELSSTSTHRYTCTGQVSELAQLEWPGSCRVGSGMRNSPKHHSLTGSATLLTLTVQSHHNKQHVKSQIWKVSVGRLVSTCEWFQSPVPTISCFSCEESDTVSL